MVQLAINKTLRSETGPSGLLPVALILKTNCLDEMNGTTPAVYQVGLLNDTDPVNLYSV